MLVLGLTGVSGSGKGYVSKCFENYNLAVIDTDKLVHTLYAESKECISALVLEFGSGILHPSGIIDRKALRNIVFSDKAALEKLNLIAHKFTLDEVRRIVNDYRGKNIRAVVVDAPQLFESGYFKECDKVISVICSNQTRERRICERDNITKEAARVRLENQHDDLFFINHSDFVIYNDGEDVDLQVKEILKALGIL